MIVDLVFSRICDFVGLTLWARLCCLGLIYDGFGGFRVSGGIFFSG